jgi:manganese/zinc/iron transport system permease protein
VLNWWESVVAYNSLVVLAATALLGAGCGLAGTFAVLRRRSLVGDVAAHAALPGLCLAYLCFGRSLLPLLLAGALVSALVSVGVVALLAKFTRLREDAVLGVVLGGFYGGGIVLDSAIQGSSAGASQAGLDAFLLGKTAGVLAGDLYWVAGAAAICAVAVVLLFKEWAVLTFDPEFGAVQGWPIARLEFLLLAVIVGMVVIGLPMVGVVMTSALLILPVSAARYWTDRLDRLAFLSSAVGATAAVVGSTVSAAFDRIPAGPAVVLTGGLAFVLSLTFAPHRGYFATRKRRQALEASVQDQLVLRWLYRSANPHRPSEPVDAVKLAQFAAWPPASWPGIFRPLADDELLIVEPGGVLRFTPKGWRAAAEAVRCECVWAALADERPEHAGLVEIGGRCTDVVDAAERTRIERRLRAERRWPADPNEEG